MSESDRLALLPIRREAGVFWAVDGVIWSVVGVDGVLGAVDGVLGAVNGVFWAIMTSHDAS